jgi:hypothetical protein
MSAYTLLEIVQDIHNDLNLDEVNTIGDTPDSLRVAQIAKTVFFELITQRDWPHLMVFRRLDGLGDEDQKTGLSIPENVSKIQWLKYNCRKESDTRDKFQDICYLYPDEFIAHANNLDSSQSNVETVTTPDGAVFYIRNDKTPQYWTSFDDNIIYFDSIDLEVDDTIQGSKTQAYVVRSPNWSPEDNYVPDLPVEAFPGYIAEIKSTASLAINEMENAKAEQQAARQRRRLSNQSWRAHDAFRTPNYGRVTGAGRQHRLFPRD